jgi:hypothetical protein
VDIRLADITEHAANQHDVRRDHTHVRRGRRGVPQPDINTPQPGTLRRQTGLLHEVVIEFHETRAHVASSAVSRHDIDDVSPLSRTDADEPHRTEGRFIERTEPALDGDQPSAQ